MKKDFMFLFYLLAGIIAGSIIANLCAGMGGLSWLAYGQTIGFSPNAPAVIDLAIFKYFVLPIKLKQKKESIYGWHNQEKE